MRKRQEVELVTYRRQNDAQSHSQAEFFDCSKYSRRPGCRAHESSKNQIVQAHLNAGIIVLDVSKLLMF